MHSVKKFFKQILLEDQISSYDIDHITNVKVDEDQDRIEFHMELIDGRTPVLYVKFSDFVKWASENYGNYSEMFKEFISGYLSVSDTEPLKEIIDDDGNIMSDDDLPSNSDNSMVGTSNKWDTSTFARQAIPPRGNAYFGTYGNGFVVW